MGPIRVVLHINLHKRYYIFQKSAYNPHLWVDTSGGIMENQRFGRLVVLELSHKDKHYNKYWKCLCDCGAISIVIGDKLRLGKTKSCGCLAAEMRKAAQNKADLERRLYTKKSWQAMINRCTNPKAPSYSRYGDAGVTVCDRWRYGENGKTGWICFFEDMGPKPFGYSIDKIDNTQGYYRENCRWATREEQNANRRRVGRIPKRR